MTGFLDRKRNFRGLLANLRFPMNVQSDNHRSVDVLDYFSPPVAESTNVGAGRRTGPWSGKSPALRCRSASGDLLDNHLKILVTFS